MRNDVNACAKRNIVRRDIVGIKKDVFASGWLLHIKKKVNFIKNDFL